MTAFVIIILIAICIALIVNSYAYSKSTMDNTGQLKTKLNGIEENLKSAIAPLTSVSIAEVIASLGWNYEAHGSEITFSVSDERYMIDTDRLPLMFIYKGFKVESKDWDIDRLKHAAHLMSDEVVMVKAIIGEHDADIILQIFVAVQDANIGSFTANIKKYLGIINEGEARLRAFYDELGNIGNGEEASATNPSLNDNQRKVVS